MSINHHWIELKFGQDTRILADVKQYLSDTSSFTDHKLKFKLLLIWHLGDHLRYTDQKREVITSNMTKKLHGRSKNNFFWTLPQHKILNDHSEANNRLVLMADFGTGKTSLLFEKATRLLEQRKTVLVFIFEVGNTSKDEDSSTTLMNESLLTTQYRLKFTKLVQDKPKLKHEDYKVVGVTEKGKAD